MQSFVRQLGVFGTVIATAVAAVAINLIVCAIGSVAGGTFDFTNNDEQMHVGTVLISAFTAVPLLAGLTLTAVLGRWWDWVYAVAAIIVLVAPVGTIFIMTIPVDLDTTSTITLAAAHIVVAIIGVWGVVQLRSNSYRRSSWK